MVLFEINAVIGNYVKTHSHTTTHTKNIHFPLKDLNLITLCNLAAVFMLYSKTSRNECFANTY